MTRKRAAAAAAPTEAELARTSPWWRALGLRLDRSPIATDDQLLEKLNEGEEPMRPRVHQYHLDELRRLRP